MLSPGRSTQYKIICIRRISFQIRNWAQFCPVLIFSVKKPPFESVQLVLPLLFRILIGCELRITEALNIQKKDVDLKKGTLLLLNTKNNKERIILIADSLHKAYRDYTLRIQFVRGANESEYFSQILKVKHILHVPFMLDSGKLYGMQGFHMEVEGKAHGFRWL